MNEKWFNANIYNKKWRNKVDQNIKQLHKFNIFLLLNITNRKGFERFIIYKVDAFFTQIK